MPVSSSQNLNFPVPGAQTGDSQLSDIQAVKSALVAIDENIPLIFNYGLNVGDYSPLTPSGLPAINITRGDLYTVEANALKYQDTVPAGASKYIPAGQVWKFLGGSSSCLFWKRIS